MLEGIWPRTYLRLSSVLARTVAHRQSSLPNGQNGDGSTELRTLEAQVLVEGAQARLAALC